MLAPTFKFDTAHGDTVDCTRVGPEYDIRVRNAKGQTAATVRMSERALVVLIGQAESARAL